MNFKTKQFPKGEFKSPCKPLLHREKLDGHTYEISTNAFDHFVKTEVHMPELTWWSGSLFNHTALFIHNMY
jgi:hypothetical protein